MSSLRDESVLMSSVSLATVKSKRRGSMKQSGSRPSGFAKVKSFWPESCGGSAGRPISVINKLSNILCPYNYKTLNNSIGTDWS